MQKSVDNLGEIEDTFLFELCELMFTYGDKARSVGLLEKVANICVSAEFTMHN